MTTTDPFNYKLQQYVDTIQNYKFIFEVTKLCGYGEFMTVFKNQSLLDLYSTISYQFENREIKSLFFLNEHTGEKIIVPMSSTTRIKDFIAGYNLGNSLVIKPIYPLPCKIVYRLYFDDGHVHGAAPCHLPLPPGLAAGAGSH
jgi:hypothetical protein